MKRFLLALGVLGLSLAAWAQPVGTAAAARRPLTAVERVVIISIDGLRPDCLVRADAPVLHGLRREGASTLAARSVAAASTLPAHVSMLTGVEPRKHGIEWNGDPPAGRSGYPAVPAIFELATRAGYRTAFIAGKPKLAVLARPGTVAFAAILGGDAGTDANVSAAAVQMIEEHRPDLLFIHFPGADAVGHATGWGSPGQLAAIAAIDVNIGAILSALERTGLRRSTVVIVTADHGGEALAHGGQGVASQMVPWLVVGPGVHAGRDLATSGRPPVRLEDTAATACWLLGLDLPEYFDGRPVREAFAADG